MKNIWIIIQYTLRESIVRKVFITFFIISTLAIIGNYFFFSFIPQEGIPTDSVNNFSFFMFRSSVSIVVSIGIFLSIFSCANFVPLIMEKGTIDLFLSKPLSRMQLILGRYLGGLFFVFLNVIYLVIGVWLIFSIKFGIWNFNLLWIILTITYAFALLNSVLILFGVLTKNSIISMMIAYLIYLILSPILSRKELYLNLISNDLIKSIINFFYYIIPNTDSILSQTTNDLMQGYGITNSGPIISTILFLIISLSLSVYIFEKKDL